MTNANKETFVTKAIKDPLIHFLIMGGLLFIFVSLWGNGRPAQNEIIVTTTTQKHLADLFEITWQRKPSADELKNLTQEHIKEEIYYREALALGLDENDTIVRRRMRQKLEFMQEDLQSFTTPTEDQLVAFFKAHIDKYMTDTIVSFQQIVVAPKKLGEQATEVVEALSQLNAGLAPQRLSRSSLLPVSMKLETEKTVTNTFGRDFMQQIKIAKTGVWTGPVYSGFGTHLVLISLRQPARPLSFKQARERVAIDYIQFQREQAARQYYQTLKDQYRIRIEGARL
jgi:hypothetical protein